MDDIIVDIYGVAVPHASKVLLPESLPGIYRLTAMDYKPSGNGGIVCTAQLYHEKASLRVTWECWDSPKFTDTLLSPNSVSRTLPG